MICHIPATGRQNRHPDGDCSGNSLCTSHNTVVFLLKLLHHTACQKFDEWLPDYLHEFEMVSGVGVQVSDF